MGAYLQHILSESAASGATSAGSIAGGGHETVADIKKNKKKKLIKRGRMFFVNKITTESVEDIDFEDVVSKMKASQKNKIDIPTTGFALEDDTGTIIKVYVKKEQAESFEKALSAELLATLDLNNDESPDDKSSSSMEIAEVLFSLKHRFDIIDVEFGTIPEDEEDVADVVDDASDTSDDTDAEMTAGDDTDANQGNDTLDAARSMLDKVIDVMKAESDAKKAEAEAKEAEAKAKEASYTTVAAREEVKKQEEILDMKEYNKKKADAEKEKKLDAELAKYKSDMELDNEVNTEDEEVSPETLARYILNTAKRQH